jgi:hypothetical protein
LGQTDSEASVAQTRQPWGAAQMPESCVADLQMALVEVLRHLLMGFLASRLRQGLEYHPDETWFGQTTGKADVILLNASIRGHKMKVAPPSRRF